MQITMTNYKLHLGDTLRSEFLRMVEVAERRHDRREIHLHQGHLIFKDPLENTNTPLPD